MSAWPRLIRRSAEHIRWRQEVNRENYSLLKPSPPFILKPYEYDEKLHLNQTLKNILNDKYQEHKVVQLFSSITKPRLPQFFPTNTKKVFREDAYKQDVKVFREDAYKKDVCNHLLQLLYNRGQYNYAREFLDEVFDDCDLNDYGSTKDIVFSEWVRKMIRPGQLLVEKEYMIHVVEKLCDTGSYPPIQSIAPLIFKLCKCGHADMAWDLIHVVLKRDDGITTVAINALLDVLGKENKLDKMKLLLPKMMFINEFSFRIVIYYLCKSERVDEALQVLHDMKMDTYELDIIIYNFIIKGLCNVGRQEEALGLVNLMGSQHGFAPNIVTYNALISGFCKAGNIENAKKLFEQMKEEGLVPTAFTYGVMSSHSKKCCAYVMQA